MVLIYNGEVPDLRLHKPISLSGLEGRSSLNRGISNDGSRG